MYALFRILLVNSLWRMWRERNARIAAERHWRAYYAAVPPKPAPPPAPAVRMIHCPDCGTRMNAAARFCVGCAREMR